MSTAHLVMAGKNGPKEETRQQVLRIADALHYQCNAAASSLKRGETRIGVVLPDLKGGNELYYTPIWAGVRAFCKTARDFNLHLVEMPYGGEDSVTVQLESVKRLRAMTELSGAILLGDIAAEAKTELRKLSDRGFPIVLVNGEVPEVGPVCCVQTEDYLMGRTMGEILLRTTRQGSAILVCAGERTTPANREAVRGLEAYLLEYAPERKIYKIYYGYSRRDAERLYAELIERLQEKKEVGGCCSVTARGSVQLARALEHTGMAGRILAIGSDIFPKNLDSLRRNVFQNLIFKNPYQQGWKAMGRLFQYIFRAQSAKGEILRVKGEVVFQSSISVYEQEDRFETRAIEIKGAGVV